MGVEGHGIQSGVQEEGQYPGPTRVTSWVPHALGRSEVEAGQLVGLGGKGPCQREEVTAGGRCTLWAEELRGKATQEAGTPQFPGTGQDSF